MNKKLLTIGSFSISLAVGYAVWIYTPLGKMSLIAWLLSKWEKMAKKKDRAIDKTYLKAELQKLDYCAVYSLVKWTRLNPLSMSKSELSDPKTKQKYESILVELKKAKLGEKIDLKGMVEILFGT